MPRHYGLNPVCKTCVFLSKTPFVLLWLESRHLSTSQPVDRNPTSLWESAVHAGDRRELLRCYYNFVRQNHGLKFGRELRTPAMQAELASRRLSFREVFRSVARMLLYVLIAIDFRVSCHRVQRKRAAA
jgi:hypothetical protein